MCTYHVHQPPLWIPLSLCVLVLLETFLCDVPCDRGSHGSLCLHCFIVSCSNEVIYLGLCIKDGVMPWFCMLDWLIQRRCHIISLDSLLSKYLLLPSLRLTNTCDVPPFQLLLSIFVKINKSFINCMFSILQISFWGWLTSERIRYLVLKYWYYKGISIITGQVFNVQVH